METRTASPGALSWAADVFELATHHGVNDFLQPMLDVTRRVFPTARRVSVRVEEDAEIPEDRRIVFVVEAALTATDIGEGQDEWYRELFRTCRSPQVWVFQLGLELLAA